MTNPKEFIRDASGATYRIGTLLGRGLFAKTFTARSEDGQEWVVKTSLGPNDFPEDLGHLVKISRSIMDEQWQILSRRPSPNILAPTSNFISETGQYCLVYPRNDHTIRQYIGQLRSFQELLRLLVRCTQSLSKLPSGLCPHGNLHPNNIFWDGKNIQFMDPMTPLFRLHHADLLRAKGTTVHTPPEYRGKSIQKRKNSWEPSVSTDTYALCLLFTGRLLRNCEEEITGQGWNKLIENNLSQSIQHLLEDNPSSNPHFQQRVLHQSIRLLDRGLSLSDVPSPPFRFANLSDFQSRLQSIIDLSNPSVSKVGSILFSGPLGKGDFAQDDEVKFSCSIHTTPQLEDHDDITSGTIIVDLNREQERVNGYDLWVDVSRLHGGRLRFQFGITGVPPGNYGLFIGFRINGSVAAPKQEYAEFQVTANVGYEPESPTVPPKTLQFPAALESKSVQSASIKAIDSDAQQTDQQETPVITEDGTEHTGHEHQEDSPPFVVQARHPLLQDRPVTSSEHTSNAIIKVPNLKAQRPQMEMPDDEFAPPQTNLSTVRTRSQTHATVRRTLAETTRSKPSLTVIPSSEPAPLQIGALHDSPFAIQLEPLIEPVTKVHDDDLSEEFHSMEEQSFLESEYTEQTDYPIDPDFTDGFSENITLAEHISESDDDNDVHSTQSPASSDTNRDTKHRKAPSQNAEDEVRDIVQEVGSSISAFIQNDPFASTIVGLVVLILLLGGIILAS